MGRLYWAPRLEAISGAAPSDPQFLLLELQCSPFIPELGRFDGIGDLCGHELTVNLLDLCVDLRSFCLVLEVLNRSLACFGHRWAPSG